MLAWLSEIARQHGLERLRINFTSTAKNKPARGFLESIGVKFVDASGDSRQFEFTPALLAALCESRKTASEPSRAEEAASSPLALPV